jgi:hypothetical protein
MKRLYTTMIVQIPQLVSAAACLEEVFNTTTTEEDYFKLQPWYKEKLGIETARRIGVRMAFSTVPDYLRYVWLTGRYSVGGDRVAFGHGKTVAFSFTGEPPAAVIEWQPLHKRWLVAVNRSKGNDVNYRFRFFKDRNKAESWLNKNPSLLYNIDDSGYCTAVTAVTEEAQQRWIKTFSTYKATI